MLKPTLWDVKTDHPASLYLYTRVYRDSQLVDVQKERLVIAISTGQL